MAAIKISNECDQLAIEASWSEAAKSGRCLAVLAMTTTLLTSKWSADSLRRETSEESARPAVGSALAHSMEAVIRANELLSTTADPIHGIGGFARSPFDCADGKVPSVSVNQYIGRFIKYTPCSREVLVTAVAYVDRFIALNSVGIQLSSLNAHRLFAAAFVVASKFASDLYYSNKFYAKVAGIGLSELNSLEAIFLTEVQYTLNIDPVTYAAYSIPTDVLATISASCAGDISGVVCSIVRELRSHLAASRPPTLLSSNPAAGATPPPSSPSPPTQPPSQQQTPSTETPSTIPMTY